MQQLIAGVALAAAAAGATRCLRVPDNVRAQFTPSAASHFGDGSVAPPPTNDEPAGAAPPSSPAPDAAGASAAPPDGGAGE